jgi:hypothetical protein
MIVTIAVTQAVPFAIAFHYNAWPSIPAFLAGFLPTIMVFWPIMFVEIITYTPMLGSGGTYIAYITGNISGMKVPCALAAMNQAEVQPSTKEGEIISTLAIAASSLVNTAILALGVFLISYLLPVLQSPALKPAFANLMPALFGAIGVIYISKNWKLAVAPIILMVSVFLIAPGLPVGIFIPVGVIVSIAVARVLYKKKLI